MIVMIEISGYDWKWGEPQDYAYISPCTYSLIWPKLFADSNQRMFNMYCGYYTFKELPLF